jgi:hypothetical protein
LLNVGKTDHDNWIANLRTQGEEDLMRKKCMEMAGNLFEYHQGEKDRIGQVFGFYLQKIKLGPTPSTLLKVYWNQFAWNAMNYGRPFNDERIITPPAMTSHLRGRDLVNGGPSGSSYTGIPGMVTPLILVPPMAGPAIPGHAPPDHRIAGSRAVQPRVPGPPSRTPTDITLTGDQVISLGNFAKLARVVLEMPASEAVCERVFSMFNATFPAVRDGSRDDLLDAQMRIKLFHQWKKTSTNQTLRSSE